MTKSNALHTTLFSFYISKARILPPLKTEDNIGAQISLKLEELKRPDSTCRRVFYRDRDDTHFMKASDLIDIPKLTRSAIREIPKTWQSLNNTYLRPVTRKEVFYLNSIAILVGISAGYAAIGFRLLIGTFQNSILHHQIDFELISPMDHVRGYWLLLILPFGLLVSTLISHFLAPETKGHGVPEVIEAVMTRGGKIRKRVVAYKALASSITIACGGSVGREGPIVQIGSAAGSGLGQLLKMDPKLVKTLVGCGAAGAIAATFNTPIAGVIFAIEIIVLELKTKSFIPLVISSVFATVVSRQYLGNEPAFIVPEYSLTGPDELFFYLILGILSGILGNVFIKVVYGFEDFFDHLTIPFWTKPLLGGIILALIALKYPETLGVGYETVSSVLQQKSTLPLMGALIVLKIFCTSLTLASGGSGGVFAPSLYVGAMFGGAYGALVHSYFPEVSIGYGAYALVGMAAMFSATGRATFTAIVILFEMTMDYSIILPLMFVCVIADQIASAISKDSIYSLKLRRKGLEFINDLSVNIMSVTLVKDIMTTELHTALESMTLKDASEGLSHHGHSAYPVVNEDRQLTGFLTKDQLKKKSQDQQGVLVKEVKNDPPPYVYPNETVLRALTKIEKTRDPRILVVERKTHKLIGIVSPIDFVRLSSADID